MMLDCRRLSLLGGLHGGLSSDIPPNEGSFRPVKVTAPLGSIVNPIALVAAEARFCQIQRMGPDHQGTSPDDPEKSPGPPRGDGGPRPATSAPTSRLRGGGYGDPLECHPAKVLDGVLDGFISTRHALDDYGLGFDPVDDGHGPQVNPSATAGLRAELHAR